MPRLVNHHVPYEKVAITWESLPFSANFRSTGPEGDLSRGGGVNSRGICWSLMFNFPTGKSTTCESIICIYIYIHVYTCMTMYVHTCMHACIHTYRQTHTHTYIHTYITLHYITLHYIKLHYITLHYITYIENGPSWDFIPCPIPWCLGCSMWIQHGITVGCWLSSQKKSLVVGFL